MITKEQFDAMLIERHGREVFDKLAKAYVGLQGSAAWVPILQ